MERQNQNGIEHQVESLKQSVSSGIQNSEKNIDSVLASEKASAAHGITHHFSDYIEGK